MTTTSKDAPKTGEGAAHEPCANCGTLLAADQRYCLNCGDRRSQARLDFIDILSEDAAARVTTTTAAAAATAPPAKTGAEGWIRSHAGVLSLATVLLLTLFGGLAIGNWLHGDSSSSSTAKPQVIKVQGGGTSTSAPSDNASSSAGSSSSDKADSKAEKGGSGSTKGVQSAKGKSSKDIAKAVDKGQPLSTGDGKSTSKNDGKPAGGGSDFETIQ